MRKAGWTFCLACQARLRPVLLKAPTTYRSFAAGLTGVPEEDSDAVSGTNSRSFSFRPSRNCSSDGAPTPSDENSGRLYCEYWVAGGASGAPRNTVSNSRQLLAMLRSRAEGDDEQFFTIALQVAASEARRGHKTVAEEIREAVEKARAGSGHRQTVAVPFAAPRGDLADLLELRDPKHQLRDVVLKSHLRAQLDGMVREQHQRDWLREHGKTPSRRLLFIGPPGSGKTMTAEALAGALKLPLFVIRLEALITRFMGETAAKLRLVFDETAKRRAVYLFDEFDAVGGHRGATNDVAEMRRVLNSFLQFMEEPNATDSVIVGATNYPDLLDRALLRRFDLVLGFEAPDDEQIKAIVKSNLRPLKFPNVTWNKIVETGRGLSQSELARAAETAAKRAILDERDRLKSADIIDALEDRKQMREAFIGSQPRE